MHSPIRPPSLHRENFVYITNSHHKLFTLVTLITHCLHYQLSPQIVYITNSHHILFAHEVTRLLTFEKSSFVLQTNVYISSISVYIWDCLTWVKSFNYKNS
jgi:hypothetical protein